MSEIIYPCHFESQKEYVSNILENEIDKRLGVKKDYSKIENLPEEWSSYKVQEKVSSDGAPTEMTIHLISKQKDRDLLITSDKLAKAAPKLLEKGLEPKAQAPDTFTPEEYKKAALQKFEM